MTPTVPVFASRSRKGFTLIEILVIIAIILLLSGILFPVFGRARENARRTACASNLKQIGIAILQYTQDFDERLPPNQCVEGGGTTMVATSYPHFMDAGARQNQLKAIYPYVNSIQIYVCPSAKTLTFNPAQEPTVTSNTSYAVNAVLSRCLTTGATNPTQTGRSLTEISYPSELVNMQEGAFRVNHVAVRPYYNGLQSGNPTYLSWHSGTTILNNFSTIHFEGGNLLFVDGHVKYKKFRALRNRDFGLCYPDESYLDTFWARAACINE